MAPTKNATQILAALNATKTAVVSEVELKMLAGVTKDTTLARFTGAVTCYLDAATGDVVGLQFGSADPLCTNSGTTRAFTVPADGYISSMKVAVDPKTDWVGQVAFVVKSNSSLVPTNIVTCGSRGAVGVDVMPKLTALASVSGACRPASAAGRRLAQSTVGLDPASLKVNVTSIAGSRVHPFAGAAYSTSKAALASLTREMAADFGPFGVRVNSISPGEIETSILSPGTEKLVAQIPQRRLGQPEEVAKAIYFLCTEQSSYVTGAELHINGGQHV
jgi:NAD(P)-dependent dehydrogenase (short-subunit alcohol dehydrogenase family)